MFTLNFIIADDVLKTTGMTQNQLDLIIAGIEQAAELWSRYIDGNNAVIDIALDFRDLAGSTLAQAGSSFFSRNNGPFESEVINELNGQAGVFDQDGTFTVDLPSVLNDRFFYADNLDFEENPGAAGQVDFLTLAAHELGHVLGFLDLSFDGFVVNNEFIGANAVVANGGNPVPLADGVHTEIGDLLGPSITSNTRYPINEVLVAILQDIGVQLVQATNGADTLYGFQQSNDSLNGQGGDDTLVGLGGNDRIYGGSGSDRVFDGGGNDNVELGSGNDYVRVGGGEDSFDGGIGVDYISYYSSSSGVTVNLHTETVSGSWAANDTVVNFERITGSRNGDDVIYGTTVSDDEGGANTIRTYGGNDRVFDYSGDDTVELGDGRDYVRVGGGQDSFDGGDGTDFISYYSSSNGVRLDFANDTAALSWARDDMVVNFEGASGSRTGDDDLRGDENENTFRGNGGEDRLLGRDGDDRLFGGDDNDRLFGGNDNDELYGESGDDFLHGGKGDDDLTGGTGSDVFHFDRGDGNVTVHDFENNIDVFEFDNFSGAATASNQAFFDTYVSQQGNDVVFNFGADGTLTVEDTTIGLVLNDFELV